MIGKEVKEWLLEGPSWIKYRTMIDLLDYEESHPEVVQARKEMNKDKQIMELLEELKEWPGKVLTNHKDATLLLHKLNFLIDLGLEEETVIQEIKEKMLAHQSEEGAFEVMMNIKKVYGGTGEDQWGWMLCDAAVTLDILVKLGEEKNSQVKRAAAFLAGLTRENGWGCSVSKELGKFRGPGRKADPCPYSNFMMVKALAGMKEWQETKELKRGIETVLQLWDERTTRKPYMFGMGTDFKKLKAPSFWYDILHLAEVLTSIPGAKEDPRVKQMVQIIKEKKDEEGRFMAESSWRAWKWEFGQKKEPSRWITLKAYRIIKRMK
ncbi:MAG: hypothetical protein KAR35_05625 [Candidatus Heimdallarchaeota archaeon]|nr:hypothetical protein [Candidatus Heimdallarchaeota archaeon]MCK5048838.1 hypothetical protein [Candidatus Heimdallarchaeota archaeon]